MTFGHVLIFCIYDTFKTTKDRKGKKRPVKRDSLNKLENSNLKLAVHTDPIAI
jgi:hypothetical protein